MSLIAQAIPGLVKREGLGEIEIEIETPVSCCEIVSYILNIIQRAGSNLLRSDSLAPSSNKEALKSLRDKRQVLYVR